MKIIYSPFYSGSYYLNMTESRVALDVQILETQGLLSQLALHAGIHQQIPSYPERLISYHKTLLEYDKSNQENIFHGSIVINSMSVAKMLLRWRDSLALCGWSSSISLPNCNRLNTLAEIDSNFKDEGTATLLTKLSAQIKLMKSGSVKVPDAYKNLIIEIHYPFQLLPDYIKPLLCSLKDVDVKIEEITEGTNSSPKAIIEIHFSQLWKAELCTPVRH